MKPETVGIIGGGAAGMAAAIAAGRQGDRVILLEALDNKGVGDNDFIRRFGFYD